MRIGKKDVRVLQLRHTTVVRWWTKRRKKNSREQKKRGKKNTQSDARIDRLFFFFISMFVFCISVVADTVYLPRVLAIYECATVCFRFTAILTMLVMISETDSRIQIKMWEDCIFRLKMDYFFRDGYADISGNWQSAAIRSTREI